MITAMGRLALVGGHGIGSMPPWAGARRVVTSTTGGQVTLLDPGDHLVLERHGSGSYTPAPFVDHPRNLNALLQAGCDRVLAICSVGSLELDLGVGSFLCPDDFIALGRVDAAFDDGRGHVVPSFDQVWRRLVIEAWTTAAGEPLRERGIYWQSPGPRFETPAEVRLIARHADVVGMTMGSECTVAGQLGLPYAAICVVDNLANGIGDVALSKEVFEAGHAANRERLGAALSAVLPLLTAETE